MKNPITLADFPLFKVKVGKIVHETPEYWIVKVNNCKLELRMNKTLNRGTKLGI
ncbi:MAG: hypothetical protein WCP92_04200 [bacterium]